MARLFLRFGATKVVDGIYSWALAQRNRGRKTSILTVLPPRRRREAEKVVRGRGFSKKERGSNFPGRGRTEGKVRTRVANVEDKGSREK